MCLYMWHQARLSLLSYGAGVSLVAGPDSLLDRFSSVLLHVTSHPLAQLCAEGDSFVRVYTGEASDSE